MFWALFSCSVPHVGFALIIGASIAWVQPASSAGQAQSVDTGASGDRSGWQTSRNDRLHYEFRFPPHFSLPQSELGDTSETGFTIGYPPTGAKGPKDLYWITQGYISPSQLSTMGITYCGAYPNNAPRCELRKVGGVVATIDWGIDVPITLLDEGGTGKHIVHQTKASVWIPHPTGGVITFELQPVVPEARAAFEQILSTFRFISDKPSS